MGSRDLTRRDFMRRTAGGFTGLGLFVNGRRVPLEASEVIPKTASPADRVNVGFIGFGIRGNILLEAVKQTGQANLVVACDCYQGHLARAKERTEGKIETNFAQYPEVLERKDVDAVVIATPDHWHLRMALDALAAGKDIYIEKPMTYRWEDGGKIIEAARRFNRIVQVGSQDRSSPLQKKAREIVQAGQIGKVTKIIASYNVGVNFNWEEWLGPAPRRRYDPERVFRYRKYWDYSGGISTDLFIHLITSIHFIMNAKMPSSVVSAGGTFYRKDGREVPDTLDALFDYPEEFQVNMGSTFNNASTPEQGMQFLGTKGSLTLLGSNLSVASENPREGYAYSIDSWPQKLQEEFMAVDDHRQEANPPLRLEGNVVYRAEGGDATALHLAEFFDCVRTRRECSENAEVGNRAAISSHMVNLSHRSGKKMLWDEAADTVKS